MPMRAARDLVFEGEEISRFGRRTAEYSLAQIFEDALCFLSRPFICFTDAVMAPPNGVDDSPAVHAHIAKQTTKGTPLSVRECFICSPNPHLCGPLTFNDVRLGGPSS